MDQNELEKIRRYRGWDLCKHGEIRRKCKHCKLEVPTYMRKEEGYLTKKLARAIKK